jgi:hypothetical protein
MKPLTIEIPELLQQKLIAIANQSNVTLESYILGILDRASEVPNNFTGTPLKTLIDIQNILNELKSELTEKYYSSVRSNPPQEGSQGEAPQWVLYSYLWRF